MGVFSDTSFLFQSGTFMQITLISKTTLCALALGFIISGPVFAQDVIVTDQVIADDVNLVAPIDIPPAKSVKLPTPSYNNAYDTHPPLKISPDKSELVRLDKDAGSIIVGSPSHLSVLADSTRTLVLVPQIPGATYVTVLDKQGNVIMQRHVIIGSPKKKYVRIRKSCNGAQDGCQSTQVYYCPDMCHKVNVAQEATESTSSGAQDTSNANNPAPQPIIEEPPSE